jgi:MOSC domain-containing protein YiiM
MCASVVSVNVGLVRAVEWQGQEFSTGIFKTPVKGPVRVETLGLQGDAQADLTVHGGKEKAVYAYPSEHYEYWKNQLQVDLSLGMFGENLTTQGLLEESVHMGDRFQVGSVELIVTRPRFPCYKLGMKFDSMEMVKRFQLSRRSGFYLAVLKEGNIAAGDQIKEITPNPNGPTIAEIFKSEQ